jgi:predicted nucleic acid-binding Zn ribbon protein
MKDEPLSDCPECDGEVRRVIQPVPILFKGPGFYVTDSKGSNPTARIPSNGESSEDAGSDHAKEASSTPSKSEE